jgi:hypothetical protein
MTVALTPSSFRLRYLAAAAILATAACTTVMNYPTTVLRPAEGVPDRFVRADRSALTGTPGTSVACESPLVDPRTGAQLMMQRSYGGRGDYSVAPGVYGVAAGELLRVDCADGTPVGIVRG